MNTLPEVRELAAGELRQLLARILSDEERLTLRFIAIMEDPVAPLPDALIDMVVEGGAAGLEKLGVGDALTVLALVRERNTATVELLSTAFGRLETAADRYVTKLNQQDTEAVWLQVLTSRKTN